MNLGVLADQVRFISQGFEQLQKSGLNKRAIVVLLQDETNLPMKVITKVLDALPLLAKRYTTK